MLFLEVFRELSGGGRAVMGRGNREREVVRGGREGF